MTRLLQAPWMIPIVGAIAFLGTTLALVSPAKLAGAHADNQPEGGEAQAFVPSWEFRNPELEQLVVELRREKDALKQREQDLKALEVRLQNERHELTLVTQSVARLQKEFDQNVLHLKEEEAANFKKLAKLYGGMSPEGAAGVFREMPDDEVARILAYMKADEVSQILDTFGRLGKTEAKRAATLTDRMRRTISPNTASNRPAP
jgi:flagellar motility protein MotE (MotC chaperone)